MIQRGIFLHIVGLVIGNSSTCYSICTYFFLFLDHSPNIRNIDKLVDFRLLSNSYVFSFWMSILQVPRLEILGFGLSRCVYFPQEVKEVDR